MRSRLPLRQRVWLQELDPALRCADPARRFELVQRWRIGRGMSRYVCLTQHDHELLIDFDNPFSVASFLHFASARGSHTVLKHFPSHEQCCVTAGGRRFAHEMIVMWSGRRRPDSIRPVPLRSSFAPRTTVLAPGSEWTYLKLYIGTREIDDALVIAYDELVAPMIAAQAIDRWVFVRYTDPGPHLRLRMRAAPGMQREVLVGALGRLADRVTRRELARIEVNTYFRNSIGMAGRWRWSWPTRSSRRTARPPWL